MVNKQTVGKAMMLVGGGGAAVTTFAGGLPQNHNDWMAVLIQIAVAAIGVILNGKGASK